MHISKQRYIIIIIINTCIRICRIWIIAETEINIFHEAALEMVEKMAMAF